MREVVRRNLVSARVPCGCLSRALASERAVSLLAIDAEGQDLSVLRQYPFGSVATWRVQFESAHMNASEFDAMADLLRAHGFVNVKAPHPGAPQSVWHHRAAQCTSCS